MSASEPAQIIDALDYRTIKQALNEIQQGAGFAEDLRTSASELGDSPDRDEIKEWLSRHQDYAEEVANAIAINKQKSIIRSFEGKEKFVEETEQGERDPDDIISHLSLTDTVYYNSFFKFADMSTKVFSTEYRDGIFQRISSEADSAQEAKELFQDHISENEEIDDVYLQAANDVPAPLIGQVDFNPKPRIIKFEDDDHVYFEFWSMEGERSYYDVNKGDYITIDQRARTSVRVHLDTGIMEYVSSKSSEDHRRAVIDIIVDNFWTSDEVRTDGGLQALATGGELLHSPVTISDDDISDVKENVGLLSTLDGFRGGFTNVRLTSRNNSDVENDPDHQHFEDNRDYRLSHPQILLGERNGEYELLDRDEISGEITISPDMSAEEIVEEFAENSDYDDVHRFTVVLNTDNDTARIWKVRCSPSTRRLVFHLISDELGW